MLKNAMILFCAAGLSACSTIDYWNKSGTGAQQTSADLYECRTSANQGGQKVYSAADIEHPCMMARGYSLSKTPPAP